MSLFDDLRSSFPWLGEVNISPSRIQQMVATSAGAAELLSKIREEPSVRARFPGLYRQDGSLRMNEAEYLRAEQEYRTLLRQSGVDVDREFTTPASLIGFFEGDLAPDELRDRLQVWRAVKEAAPNVQEVFYVYAGLTPSVDDLFEAAVNPSAEQELHRQYNAQVAAMASGPDAWREWITRATEAGMSRVARILTDAQIHGSATGAVVQRILNTDPNFAREIMAALYVGGDGGDPGQAGTVGLSELLDSFEFMAVGAAARSAGLEMPTRDRLGEIRAAGVDRTRMIQGYRNWGINQGSMSAAVQRARGTAFGTREFEQAEFMGEAGATHSLLAGQAYMEAAGRDVGAFRFAEERGRFAQTGFTNR